MRLQSKLNLSTKFSGATFPEKIARINHKLMPPEVDYVLEHSESKIFFSMARLQKWLQGSLQKSG